MATLVPLLVLGSSGLVLVHLITLRVHAEDRRWLLNLLLVALALRLATATIFELVPESRFFHEDAEGYELIGMRLAEGWRGVGPRLDLARLGVQNVGYYYLCGFIYYALGSFRAAPAYINAVLGTTLVFLVYRLAGYFFHKRVARYAATLTALVPSMVLWSSMALKDTLMTFLIVIALSSCVRLKRRFTLSALLGTVIPVVAIQPIRFYIIYFLGFAILTSLVLERGVRTLSGVYKQVAIGGFFIGLLVLVGFSGRAEQGVDFLTLERVAAFRHGMSTTARSGLTDVVDISTPMGALLFLPFGVTNLLLSPFPWQFTSARAAFAAPEMVFWWSLLPSLWRGLRFSIKHRFRETSPVLLFSLVLTLAYSLMHGNVGSGFRQRAQIFVFLFIFTALGVYDRRCRRAGIDSRALLAGADVPLTET